MTGSPRIRRFSARREQLAIDRSGGLRRIAPHSVSSFLFLCGLKHPMPHFVGTKYPAPKPAVPRRPQR